MGKAALLFLMLGMGGSTVSQQAETSRAAQPISVVIRTDHEKYSLADDVRLDVLIANAGKSPLTVFGEFLCWHAGGLVLHVTDTSNKEVPARALDDDIVVPSTLEDRNSFVILNPNHYLDTGRRDKRAG